VEAYVTVTDAAGRVLFRRPATGEEIAEALVAADRAERNARETLADIGAQRRDDALRRAAAPAAPPPPRPQPMRDVTPQPDAAEDDAGPLFDDHELLR
jgi:hypothetical protein